MISHGNVSTAMAVWIAVATLHKEHGTKRIFTKQNIIHQIKIQKLCSVADSTISTHISAHCVANTSAIGKSHKMLHRVGQGSFKLHKAKIRLQDGYGDDMSAPPVSELPEGFQDLRKWYYEEYCR